MENWILRVGNNLNNFEAVQKEWLKYHVFIKMVQSMPEALKLLTKIDFLLVVIIADGIEYLPYLRLMRDMKPVPILALSSKYKASEKLEAIQLGVDEYLPYPSTVEEAVASGRALIRRYTVLNHQAEKPLTVITYHEIFMCVEYRKFFLKGKEIKLTRKEFDLLYLLLSSIGRVYTHEQIYLHVWGGERDIISDNYAVWCLVTRVRKKLRSVLDIFEAVKGHKLELGVILGAFYGLRRGEIVGLKWEAIDFEANTITIEHTVTMATIDGKRVVVEADTTKSKSSYRTLPLVPQFRAKLLAMWDEQQYYKKLCGKSYNKAQGVYIYVDQLGNRIKPDYLTREFPDFMVENGFRKMRFHDLRHYVKLNIMGSEYVFPCILRCFLEKSLPIIIAGTEG